MSDDEEFAAVVLGYLRAAGKSAVVRHVNRYSDMVDVIIEDGSRQEKAKRKRAALLAAQEKRARKLAKRAAAI